MKTARLQRLFHPRTRRCVNVAIDHGLFNEPAFLAGIENLISVINCLAAAAPDAIQLSVGQAPHFQGVPVRPKPALVLRTDVANVYGLPRPRRLFSRMIEEAVLQAVRLDAACVVVNLFSIPGEPEVGEQCVENILRIKPACDHFGVPLMIEPLVFQADAKAGYMVNGDPTSIIPLVRQAVELGADIIKADPTDDLMSYHKVVESAGCVPVLVRGGGKATEAEIITRTETLLSQGAAGIVYGRNIIQHTRPDRITQALMAVVHGGVSAKDALNLLV